MMKRNWFGAFLVALIFLGQTASAHHAANTKYDQTKKATLTGTVTKVEWLNPHIYFYIDVKDSSGKVVNWAVEGAPPNVLYRRGWGKDALKIGDVVTVEARRARDGSNNANAQTVTLAGTGQRLLAGSALLQQ